MYPAMSGSPNTTTTAAIGVSDTEIAVAELSVLPAAPNICVIYVRSTKWERCLYSAKSNASGAGTITVARSGDGHASTDGSNGPLEFDSGAKVMRNFTAYDHDLFKDNIEDLAVNKQPLDATLTAFAGITTAANKLPYATGEDAFDVCDFTSLGQSLIGTTTASAVRDLIAAASSTTATQSIYVDSAATGTGTGVDWANAFTTIQAAVDSLPAIVNHAVTIWIRKGATPYAENITIRRVIAAGSIVIRGEYYWYGTVAASKTGKITLGVSDYGYANRAQIAVGDIIWLTKWSGTVNVSTPSQSLMDTVASVSDAEITLTTNTTQSFDTTWTYNIVKTSITPATGVGLTSELCPISIQGLKISGAGSGIYCKNRSKITGEVCYISGAFGINTSDMGVFNLSRCAITGGTSPAVAQSETGRSYISKCYLFSSSEGVRAYNGGHVRIEYSAIESNVSTGLKSAFGGFIYQSSILNSATTLKSPASATDPAYIN